MKITPQEITGSAKRVRGLSLLQKRIMAVAAKGWITPHEARACAMEDYSWDPDKEPLEIFYARVAASSSRALRRLVTRGLLMFREAKYVKQSNAYVLPSWHGDLPCGNSQHSDNKSRDWSDTDETLMTFDAALAARQKNSDASLTKAERELGERLNTPLTEEAAQVIAACLADLTACLADSTNLRLNASLTESLTPDVSDEDGRKVLVNILSRQWLGAQKSLVAGT